MLLSNRKKTSEAYVNSEKILHDNDHLSTAVAKLRQANNYLTRRMQLQANVRMVQQSLALARLLALWHCGGFRTGKRAALSMGMTEHGWYHGRALLMAALIYDNNGFTTNDPNEIEQALTVAVERIEKKPSLFLTRLPLSRRPRRGMRGSVREGMQGSV